MTSKGVYGHVELEADVGGRPEGSVRHTNMELREAFQKHTFETSKLHSDLDIPIWALQGSVAAVWRSDGQLKEMYCRRWMANRLQGCKCAVGKARGRTDTCDICTTWDTVTSIEIGSVVDTFVKAVTSLVPDYFAKSGWETERHLYVLDVLFCVHTNRV